MFDVFNKYRNKDGYINLAQVPNKQFSNTFRTKIKEIIIDGTKYYFKVNGYYKGDIREIINEEIAKQVGCDNAEYDLAAYENQVGVISKNFVQSGEEYQYGGELLSKVGNNSNCLYNYILSLIVNKTPPTEINGMTKKLLIHHILDICSFQIDRHYGNVGFLRKGNTINLAPRYDNEESFLSYSNVKDMKSFLESQNKKEFINDVVTDTYYLNYFRLLPGNGTKDAITDYLESSTWETIPNNTKEKMLEILLSILPGIDIDIKSLYNIMRKSMLEIDSYINTAYQVNFEEIYYYLAHHNVKLSPIEKDYYKEFYKTSAEFFIDKKQKIR